MNRADALAGLSIAGLMLPEAIAYAGIAGLPPQHAILAALAGASAYLLLGRSRFAMVSPTSSSAAILAAALGSLSLSGSDRSLAAMLIVAMVGLMFSLLAVARLGALANFVSRPVLRGFGLGLAITIIIKQLPIIVGQPLHIPAIGPLLVALGTTFPQWHLASVATALAALAALIAMRRFPAVPGAFLVLGGGIAASILFDFPAQGIATVGTIDFTLEWPRVSLPDWQMLSRLAQLSAPIVLILFAESWGSMRNMALRHGDTIEPDREMGALGLANLASAMVQGMPVGAGFSAASAAEAAGARTRWTGLFAALTLGALVLFAMPLVARLPQPVLAAVVIAALFHALDPAPLVRLWRIDRDLAAAAGAALGVLMFGVLDGMLFAILLSIALLIRRLAAPQLTRLGQLGGGHDYVDMARHPEATPPAGILIVRPAEPLFFANAERVLARIASLQAAEPANDHIVLSLEESFDIDSTALDALTEFSGLLDRRGVSLHLARVRDHVRDLLQRAGADGLVARSSFSVDDAVQAINAERRHAG